jgi:hypothetical protein
MEIDFNPEDRAPDPLFAEVGKQARLSATYMQELKDQGLSEYEAVELTQEWMRICSLQSDE